MDLLVTMILISLSVRDTFSIETYKADPRTLDHSWVLKGLIASIISEQEVKSLTGASKEDAYLNFEEIVKKNRYPVETHNVTTEDGYILTIHRIPHGRQQSSNSKGVVFVQHGLLCSSADWIIIGPPKALGYLLADHGFDVWLGNARGNTYSRRHVTLDPDKDASKFWYFSWDEIGYYDIPKMIDYVLYKTGKEKLFHIGYSQGTTTFYVMTSLRPEYNDKIIAHFSLSPVAFMSNLLSPIVRVFSPPSPIIYYSFRILGIHEMLPSKPFLTEFARKFCADEVFTQSLCSNALFAIAGFSRDEMNATLIPILAGHFPAGSSTKQFVHYAQLYNSGTFRRWDYGCVRNYLKYGQITPPKYDLRKITAPVYLFFSINDWLSAVKDVNKLAKQLPNLKGRYLNRNPTWNHLDYLYGINADKNVYKPVVEIMLQQR